MPADSQKRPSFLQRLFGHAAAPAQATAAADKVVTPDATRCVQCGVCGYNCPVGIPVRDFACRGLIVDDARCVQCNQCIDACPRGTLRWGPHPRLTRAALPEIAPGESLEDFLQRLARKGGQP